MIRDEQEENHLDLMARDGMRRLGNSRFCRLDVVETDGRRIKSGRDTLVDFATSCYLDLDADITEEDVARTRTWGVRNGWSRITGTTSPSRDLEQGIARALRLDEVRLAQSVSLINGSLLLALSRIFPLLMMDVDTHATLKLGAKLAAHRRIRYWAHNDLDDLERKLRKYPSFRPKLVIVDGIYSMKGTFAPISELLRLCVEYDGYLMVDDAHGFGVVGESGFGVIEHLRDDELGRVIYIASFSKCASNPVAFLGFPSRFAELIDLGAPCLCYSGPPSNLHVIIANRHFSRFRTETFARKRSTILHLSRLIHEGCLQHGIPTFSDARSPLVAVRIRPQHLEEITANLYASGLLGKPAIYPVTRFGEEVVRFSMTAGHSEEQARLLLSALVRNRALLGT